MKLKMLPAAFVPGKFSRAFGEEFLIKSKPALKNCQNGEYLTYIFPSLHFGRILNIRSLLPIIVFLEVCVNELIRLLKLKKEIELVAS